MIFYFEKSKKFSITIFYCNFGERHLSYGKFTIMVNVVSDKVIYPSLCILYLGRRGIEIALLPVYIVYSREN